MDLFVLKKTQRGNFVRLTQKGEDRLRKFELMGYKLKKPKKWDKKWRMLIFDIKEERKGTRDKIRFTLKRIGFCVFRIVFGYILMIVRIW